MIEVLVVGVLGLLAIAATTAFADRIGLAAPLLLWTGIGLLSYTADPRRLNPLLGSVNGTIAFTRNSADASRSSPCVVSGSKYATRIRSPTLAC